MLANLCVRVEFMSFIINNIALIVPAILFSILAVAEIFSPRRPRNLPRKWRWITHFIFLGTNNIIGQLLVFIIVIPTAANWAADNQFGLFNLINLPWWAEALIAVILLDFAVWFQHRIMHRYPLLWRLHSVHHSDRDLDVTSALRFHPLELILSTLYKSAWVVLLGVPLLVAIFFEIWLNACAMFNHSNIKLPKKFDRVLRLFIVTPDMHIVHHTTNMDEQNSNYGFALSLWDRIFQSYNDQPRQGHDKLKIGLTEAQNEAPSKPIWSLLQPFRNVN